MEIRKLPVGVESFEDMRQSQYLYVDKTALIYDLAQLSTPYFLSRPRRFGKSLLLSAIEAYFMGRKELFTGLAIEQLESQWAEHPVLKLALNGKNYKTEKSLDDLLNSYLVDWEKRYVGATDGQKDPDTRFANVIKAAYEKTRKKVVVLIDEYDKPMLDTIDNRELYKANMAAMRGFYGVLKRVSGYLRFTMLTGITRIANLSVFSELNQLDDISMHPKYATICGITQSEMETVFMPEIDALACTLSTTRDDILAQLKRRYNGYRFSRTGESIYNPFSLIKNFGSYGEFGDYWFATGTPTFLVNRLRQVNFDIPKLEDDVVVAQQTINDYRIDDPDPVPLLYQSGYLTIKAYKENFKAYVLGFPNDEVRYGFYEALLKMYVPVRSIGDFHVGFFNEDLETGKLDAFMNRLKAYYSSISYDVNNKTERDFKTIFYLLLKMMGQFPHTEVCSAAGRSDIEVRTDDAIYIFELKMSANGNADDALQQIKDKDYAGQYAVSGKRIICVGIEFDETMRTVKEWKNVNSDT